MTKVRALLAAVVVTATLGVGLVSTADGSSGQKIQARDRSWCC